MRQTNSEEVSLRDLILKIKEYFSYFISKKFFIAVIVVAFFLFFGLSAYFSQTYFKAERTFFLEGDNAGSSGFGGLLGQIGIGGGKTNPFQVLEVANSNSILAKVVFNRPRNDKYIGNRIIDLYDLNTKWGEDKENYKPFYFTHNSIEDFNTTEKKALLQILKIIAVNGDDVPFKSIMYDEDKAFFTIKTQTLDHDLTLDLNQVIYDEIKVYYELQATKGLKQTRDMLEIKLDSLDGLFNRKMYQLGRYNDQTRGLVSIERRAERDILQREVSKLSLSSLEINKMYEIADYNYQNQKPGFILIDKPFTPLIPQNKNLRFELIKGILMGLFISLFFLFIFKTYNDIMEH